MLPYPITLDHAHVLEGLRSLSIPLVGLAERGIMHPPEIYNRVQGTF